MGGGERGRGREEWGEKGREREEEPPNILA